MAVSLWQGQSTIYTGRSYVCAHLTTLTTSGSHGRVSAEPKFSLIRKRPILRALRHSKSYKYTLEEEKRGDAEEEARNFSRKVDRSISEVGFTIKTEDLPSNSPRSFVIFILLRCVLSLA
ncbi:hypothetical protein F383_33374 [Gossypium arboreum]|uniref:Uncharacterized protein n=1 Tax=Gossypium arboreum TaxID=29729 RepID=A0A0B0PRG4_GOSAR|nr:hypothetical protein F383_33374 [Gossypium arboreum]